MISEITKTAETVIYDDDGYRYRVFLGESGMELTYEEYVERDSTYMQKAKIGFPFRESAKAISDAILHAMKEMKE